MLFGAAAMENSIELSKNKISRSYTKETQKYYPLQSSSLSSKHFIFFKSFYPDFEKQFYFSDF